MKLSTTGSKDISNLLMLGDVDLESFSGLSEWFKDVTDTMRNALNIILNTKTDSMLTEPEQSDRLQRMLGKLKLSDVADYKVYTVVGSDVYLSELAEQYATNLKALRNLDKRVYQPLIGLLAGAIRDGELGLWTDKDFNPINHTKNKKDTESLYAGKLIKDGPADVAPFSEVFGYREGVAKTEEHLVEAVQHAKSFNLDDISVKEKRIEELSRIFVQMHEEGNMTVNKRVMPQVVQWFRAAAQETSFLVFNLYQLNKCVTAYNDSVIKLTEDLK